MTDAAVRPSFRRVHRSAARFGARLGERLATLVASPTNAAISAVCLLLLAWVLPGLWRWAVTDATWSGTPQQCRAAGGACWAFIGEKFRFFLYGMYPAEERWRALSAMLLLLATLGVAMVPRFWGLRLAVAAVVGIVAAVWLLVGGVGLTPIQTERIGGLPATLMLTLVALPIGFPLAVVLAFARRSDFWLFRGLATAVVELLRCTPMIAILFMTSVMLPFFVPADMAPPKLARACCAFALVAAAYMAEALRGGIQAVPNGQREAAVALGIRPFAVVTLVILPQAIRMSIPGLLNVVVAFFKDTSLIVVIGMADFLGAIQLATRDPAWVGFNVEGYVFAALVYFVFCHGFGLYARHLERRGAPSGRGG